MAGQEEIKKNKISRTGVAEVRIFVHLVCMEEERDVPPIKATGSYFCRHSTCCAFKSHGASSPVIGAVHARLFMPVQLDVGLTRPLQVRRSGICSD